MNLPTQLAGLSLGLLLIGCDKAAPPAPLPSNTNVVERVFATRGVVRSVPETGRTLVVRHDAIPGYMPQMTMELNVRDTNELRGLERDDEITFRLVATADTHWIEHIQRVGRQVETNAPAAPASPPGFTLTKELETGDALPDYELTAEDGRMIRFSDFRGRALAFTFFFTRCPLPDYCPRMNNNFAAARDRMLGQPNAPTNWQFLCISFDSEHDSPEVLRSHAKFYRHNNPDRWLFAVATPQVLATLAPELDLMFAKDVGGSISHNLRTVVLDPQGRIYRQFDGNHWTPAELAEALLAAAQIELPPPSKH
jgi:protein SCO1/2